MKDVIKVILIYLGVFILVTALCSLLNTILGPFIMMLMGG